MRRVQPSQHRRFMLAGLMLFCLGWWGCALPPRAAERLATVEEPAESASAPLAQDEKDEKVVKKEKDESLPIEQATSANAKVEQTPSIPAQSPAAEEPASAKVDPRALAAVMSQMQELRALDPPAHDQLLADLKHVDPKHWPMLVQGFKASVEYRQRKQTAALSALATVAASSTAMAPRAPEIEPPPVAARAPVAPAIAKSEPASVTPVSAAHEVATPAAPPIPTDWRQPLEATIRSLEAAVAESPAPAEDDRQVSLRLLYLLSGQRDKALRPLTGHDPLAQEFWSRELYALSIYLDSQRVTDRSRRAAEAALHHWDASNRLSQQGNLLVRNLAFCTEVMSYGVYTPFDRLEFQPGQRVVIYAEVENFISQPTPRGHHTALKSSYQIFDARGQKVEDHEFPPMQEHCQNPRRDFFIAYEAISLPAQLYEGKHTLKLTIEDTLGHKIGQSSLDFHIKPATAERAKSVR